MTGEGRATPLLSCDREPGFCARGTREAEVREEAEMGRWAEVRAGGKGLYLGFRVRQLGLESRLSDLNHGQIS